MILLIFVTSLAIAAGAPTSRQEKSLPFFDFMDPAEYRYNLNEDDNYISLGEEEIARARPYRKPHDGFNSPIYYIRLPPQPYVFVPGLGYISQPPTPQMSQFLNVPVSFIANGKPSTIYQWAGGLGELPLVEPPQQPRPRPPTYQKPANNPQQSTVHRLPGQYNFNGKPDDILVLRDSYNSLYGDALQNFYP